MKIGQIQIIFTWIFILILAIAILFYGIKTAKKTQELGNEAVVINFFKNLNSRINTYYYLSMGSSNIEEFSLPNDVSCVCFTKNWNIKIPNDENKCGNINLNYKNYFEDLKDYDNVFLFSSKNYQQDRINATFVYVEDEYNPTCIEVNNGLLRFKLENIGIKGVNISNV